jgi:hypothetical protein
VPKEIKGEFTIEPVLGTEKQPFKTTVEKTRITL